MANHEQCASSSSLIGRSKVCPNPGRASSISSAKCTKPRSSLARMDQSVFTAGNARILPQQLHRFLFNLEPPLVRLAKLQHKTLPNGLWSWIRFQKPLAIFLIVIKPGANCCSLPIKAQEKKKPKTEKMKRAQLSHFQIRKKNMKPH